MGAAVDLAHKLLTTISFFAVFPCFLYMVWQWMLMYLNPKRKFGSYNLVARSRSALAITLTDDSAIAAAAITGVSRMPVNG